MQVQKHMKPSTGRPGELLKHTDIYMRTIWKASEAARLNLLEDMALIDFHLFKYVAQYTIAHHFGVVP